MADSTTVKEALLANGLLETIDGCYIAASVIARIIPNRKKGVAVCKDRFGNRIALLPWEKDEEISDE